MAPVTSRSGLSIFRSNYRLRKMGRKRTLPAGLFRAVQIGLRRAAIAAETICRVLQVKPAWVYKMCRRRAGMKKYLHFHWPDICEWMRNGSGIHTEGRPRRWR
jgi:hypothetical protein